MGFRSDFLAQPLSFSEMCAVGQNWGPRIMALSWAPREIQNSGLFTGSGPTLKPG